jgi:hypothetical protein
MKKFFLTKLLDYEEITKAEKFVKSIRNSLKMGFICKITGNVVLEAYNRKHIYNVNTLSLALTSFYNKNKAHP